MGHAQHDEEERRYVDTEESGIYHRESSAEEDGMDFLQEPEYEGEAG